MKIFYNVEIGQIVGEIRMSEEKEKTMEKMESEMTLESVKIKPIEDFVSPEKLHDELINSIRKYHPSADISAGGKGISCG